MELKNCIECGRSFASKDGELLCKRCTEKRIEEDFKKVRDYLYDNPGSDIKIVSRDTGVEERIILRLLREDRIEVVEEENSVLKCISCGKAIKSGKFCQDCKKIEITKEFRDLSNSLKEDLEKNKKENNIVYHSKHTIQ